MRLNHLLIIGLLIIIIILITMLLLRIKRSNKQGYYGVVQSVNDNQFINAKYNISEFDNMISNTSSATNHDTNNAYQTELNKIINDYNQVKDKTDDISKLKKAAILQRLVGLNNKISKQ